MASRIQNIRDAVVSHINGEDWTQDFTAVAAWRARYKLTELADLKVVVLPGPATFEPLNRGADKKTQAVDLAVLMQVNPDKDDQVDPLVVLMEELVAHFFAKQLDAGSCRIVCGPRRFVRPEDAAIDEGILREWQVYVGVVRLIWLVQ